MRNKDAQALIESLEHVNLLPCPFCGENENKPSLCWDRDKNIINEVYFGVQCSNCGCYPKHYCAKPEEAIAIWNTRPIQSNVEIATLGFNQAKEVMSQMLHQLDAMNYLTTK